MKQPIRVVFVVWKTCASRKTAATLASLNRGIGQPPGTVLETSRVVEHMLDEDDPDVRQRDAVCDRASLCLSTGSVRWRSLEKQHGRSFRNCLARKRNHLPMSSVVS